MGPEGSINASNNNTQVENEGNLEGRFVISSHTIPAIVMMVFILVINGGVILLISSYSHLRTTSNTILASLALSDFLVGLVGIPLLVVCSSAFSMSICLGSTIFFNFVGMSTVSHIVVMTCDRYIYIVWALRYRDIINRSRVLAVLGLTWLVSLTALVRLAWMWHVNEETLLEDVEEVRYKDSVYLVYLFTVFFAFPFIIMITLDTHMLLLLKKQCHRIMKENLPAECLRRENRFQRRQRRVVLICVFLLLTYVTCWLPYFILDLLQFYSSDTIGPLSHTASLFIYYLRLCTSLFNPLLYTLRKPDLRKAVKSLAFKVCPHLRPRYSVENRTEEFVLTSRTD